MNGCKCTPITENDLRKRAEVYCEGLQLKSLIAKQAAKAVHMAKRSSLRDVVSSDQLSNLDELVVDKRYGKRAKAKKARRNRHYEKQFLRNAVTTGLVDEQVS